MLTPGCQPVVLTHRPHPFRLGREVLELPAGLTLAEMIGIAQPDPVLRRCMDVRISGHRIPEHLWHRVWPRPGVMIDMVPVPQGGNDTLRLVLIIAVVALATAATGGIAGAGIFAAGGALAGWGAVAGAVGGALVSTVGMLAVNALVPPSQPQIANGGSSSSATYSIEGASNRARPDAPIPRVLGVHRLVADLAVPWVTELDDQDEFLHGIVCWGFGPCSIAQLRIGETPVENFQGIAVEHHNGDTDTTPSFTLYPNQVSLEQISAELRQGTRVLRTTDTDTDTDYALLTFQYRTGAITVSKKTGDELGVTVTLRYRWRPIGGSWSAEADWTLPAKSSSPIKKGRRIEFGGRGQYDIEIWRTTPNSQTDSQRDTVHWEQLKSGNYDAPLRGIVGVAFTAIRIKATDQLSGVIQDLSALITSYALAWNGSAWVYGPTGQPAALFRSVLQGRGAKTPVADSKLDLAQLQYWATRSDAQGWFCNLVIDREISLGETLDLICATARAAKLQVDGRWSVAIDEAKSTAAQMFTARNMRNFRGRRLFVEEPHALRVRFVDATAGWTQQTRLVYADGYSAANASLIEDAEFPGVTDPRQIQVFGRMRLAEGRLRAETYTAEVDFEHLVCTRGDLVRVQHSAPLWGLGTARIKALVVEEGYLTSLILDERLTFDGSGTDYVIRVRRADTTFFVADIFDPLGEAEELFLRNAPVAAGTGIAPGDLVVVGVRNRETVELLVRSIEPSGDLAAQIAMIPYAPGIFTAASEPIPPWDPIITPPGGSRVPIIEAVLSGEATGTRNPDGTLTARVVVRLANDGTRPLATIAGVELGWRPVLDTGPFQLVQAPADASTITILGASPGLSIVIRARFRLYSGAFSAWSSDTLHKVIGPTLPPLDVTGLVFDGLTVRWTFVPGPDHDGFVVRWGPAPGTTWEQAEAASDAVVREQEFPAAALPLGTRRVLVKAITKEGLVSAAAATLVVDIGEAQQRVVLDSLDLRALGWPGKITGAELVAGELHAIDNGGWLEAGQAPWLTPPDGLWLDPDWADIVYVAQTRISDRSLPGDRMQLRWEGTGTVTAEYRWGPLDIIIAPFDQPIPDNLLEGDWVDPLGASDFSDSLKIWRAWRQGVAAVPGGRLQLRFTVRASGNDQPVLRAATLTFDGAELVESFTALSIRAENIFRLPTRRAWRVISYVIGTVAENGPGKWLIVDDRERSGPAVHIENIAGARVAGTADITIGGG